MTTATPSFDAASQNGSSDGSSRLPPCSPRGSVPTMMPAKPRSCASPRTSAASLQRHGRERREAALVTELLPHAVVQVTAPREALRGRQLVAEAVEPPADYLVIDAALVHSCLAVGKVGEPGHDRPGGLDAGKLDSDALVGFQEPDIRELRGIGVKALDQQFGGEVRVYVDDYAFHGGAARIVVM